MPKKSLFFVFALCIIALASCKKQEIILNESYAQNPQFFSRNSNAAKNPLQRDFIDTIIGLMKVADLKTKFAGYVNEHYGTPDWNSSIRLSNANGMRSLVIPIVDPKNNVPLVMFAYQTAPGDILLRFIDRDTKQLRLPLHGNPDKKQFTQYTLKGLFTSLQKAVEVNRKEKEIATNATYIMTTTCWWYSIFYPDGALLIADAQCSTDVVM